MGVVSLVLVPVMAIPGSGSSSRGRSSNSSSPVRVLDRHPVMHFRMAIHPPNRRDGTFSIIP